MLKKKKGQEEIMGFVLIVVVMSIVMLVFLGIYLRTPPSDIQRESKDIYQFLEGMMEYTSDCAISYEPAYSSLGGLIQECYSDSEKKCTNGKKACVILERSIKEALNVSWQVGPDRPIKAYEFRSDYESDYLSESIISISKGNCTAGFSASEYLSPAYPGTIVSSLKLCF